MAILKLTKEDIINNKYNVFLSMMYSIILAVVYSTWVYRKYELIWPIFIISFGFLLAGAITAYLWSASVKQQSSEK